MIGTQFNFEQDFNYFVCLKVYFQGVTLESSFSCYKMYSHAITRIQVQSKTLKISESYWGACFHVCNFINFDSVGHQSNSTQRTPSVMLRKASFFLSFKIKSISNTSPRLVALEVGTMLLVLRQLARISITSSAFILGAFHPY